MEQTRKARTYGRVDYLDHSPTCRFGPDTPVEWRATNFPGYEVCSDGRVRSARGILRPYKTGDARSQYLTVAIGGKNCKVHRLVADAFIPQREGATQVNHIDGDKLNNAVWNLERVTAFENVKHAYRVLGNEVLTRHWWGGGGHKGKTGALHHCSKPIRAILPSGDERVFASVIEAARTLGLSKESVGRVANGVYRTTKGHRFSWEAA